MDTSTLGDAAEASDKLVGTASSTKLSQLRKKLTPALHDDDAQHDHHPETWHISRSVVNFWLDAWLLVNFVLLGIAAVIVQFVFPPGVATRGWKLWSFSYGQWCSIQFGLLAIMGVGVLVHIMLHWTWVCSVVAKRLLKAGDLPDDGLRTVYGVGLLIGILVISAVTVGIAMSTIVEPPVGL